MCREGDKIGFGHTSGQLLNVISQNTIHYFMAALWKLFAQLWPFVLQGGQSRPLSNLNILQLFVHCPTDSPPPHFPCLSSKASPYLWQFVLLFLFGGFVQGRRGCLQVERQTGNLQTVCSALCLYSLPLHLQCSLMIIEFSSKQENSLPLTESSTGPCRHATFESSV